MTDYICEIKSNTGQLLFIFEDHVELTQTGAMGLLTQGLKGTKTFFYTDISSIEFKNCGLTNGYIEFKVAGQSNTHSGAWGGMNNENRFVFGATTLDKAKQLAADMAIYNEVLQNKLKQAKMAKNSIPVAKQSTASEIKEYKALLDEGIITQEEFDAKKKQLLGL